MRGWAIELAFPWLWHGGVCEQLLCALYWTDGPGVTVSFTRDARWQFLRVIGP